MKISTPQKSLVFFIMIILSFGMIAFPFINVIIFSFITAFFSKWLYKFLLKKVNPTLSIITTWIAIFITICVPLYFLTHITFVQVQNAVEDVQEIITQNWEDELAIFSNTQWEKQDNTIFHIKEKLETFKTDYKEEFKLIEDTLTDNVKKVWEGFIAKTKNILAEIPIFIIKVILYVFLTTSLLINWKKVKKIIKAIIPINNSIIDIYISRMQEMTIGIIKWSLVVALIQATLTTISFMLVWVPYAWIVFILSFLLYIPMVWTVLLYIPVIMWLIFTWSYISAIIILFWNSIVVANVDNVLRGRFVTGEAKVDNSLIFLSMLSWLTLFWVMWVLYGPLIVIIWVTSIKIYMEMQEKAKKG